MHKLKMTRRRFLGLLGAGAVVAVAGVAAYSYRPYVRRLGTRFSEWAGLTHVAGPLDQSPVDPVVLSTVAVFTGALFGRSLPPDSLNELVDRLDFAAKQDSGWREEYLALASYVDGEMQHRGAADFTAATFDERDAMIKGLMANSPLKLLSPFSRTRSRMYLSTIPHLTKMYSRSGVPYRLRGYTSWPGIPGDQLEYTRKGPSQEC